MVKVPQISLNSRPSSAVPRAAFQPSGGGTLIVTPEQMEEALKTGNVSASGQAVTTESALGVAAVYACVRLIAGAVATLPLDIKRRVDDRTRVDASDSPIWRLLRRKPNRWQTPSQFKRMMQTHLLLRGNAYALIVFSVIKKDPYELIPLHPDRVTCSQNDDLSLSYTYATRAGRTVSVTQAEMFHLVGLTLDGVKGVSVLTYARESIGESLAMTQHGAATFKNGARVSGVLSHPGKLGDKEFDNLKASLDQFRADGERDGKAMILEEGMKFDQIAMTSADAQWVEGRKFTRSEIAMFFGVPPTMIGDNSGSDSNWGTGLEQKSNGFVAYALEDHLTTWEETIHRDLIIDPDSPLYARFNRAALVRGDIKTRYDAYLVGRQMKVLSANDVRGLEDWNPVEGGDVYENPLITVNPTVKEPANEPSNAA